MFACILGNHPTLSLAEILSLFCHANVLQFDENIVLISEIEEDEIKMHFSHIGGTIKAIKIQQGTKNIHQIAEYLDKSQEGKITFGVNLYGTR